MQWNLRQIFRWPDAQVLAVCDVDSKHLAEGRQAVDQHYSQVFGKDYKECATYGDFRELVRRKDLDAVANCTPDHWHVLPALMAVKCGKDVICEKPLTLFVEEGRVLANAVKEHQRVFQTASENRSITIAHLGNIAMLLGRKLRWNPDAEKFVDAADADALLTRKQREPWTLANVDQWT